MSRTKVAGLILTMLIAWMVPVQAQQYERSTFRLGLEGGFNIPGDEFTQKQTGYPISPGGLMTLEYFPFPNLGFHAIGYGGAFANGADNLRLTKYKLLVVNRLDYKTTYYGGATGVTYAFPDILHFTPILFARAGLLLHKTAYTLDGAKEQSASAQSFAYGIGVSVEYPLSQDVSARASFSGFLTSTDELDGFALTGGDNDGFSMFTLGFFWRLNPNKEMPREPWQPPTGKGPVMAPRDMVDDAGTRQPSSRAEKTEDQFDPSGESSIRPTEKAQGNTDLPIAITTQPPPSSSSAGELSASLSVEDFLSFTDLQRNPQLMQLRLQQEGTALVPVRILIELHQGGRVVASGSREVVLEGGNARLDAGRFIDFSTLSVRDGYDTSLPSGEYSVIVSARHQHSSEAVVVGERLSHIDYASIFGEDAQKIREMVRAGTVGASLHSGNEVVFNTFGNEHQTMSLLHGSPVSSAARGEVIREAASIVPPHVPPTDRGSYLADAVQDGLNKALLIDNAIKRPRRTSERVSVVLTEFFFPFDVANLTDEARSILNNVAITLIQHPELGAEIRGFADEVGDASYNNQLSQRRAERVFEYLSRKLVPETRLRARGMGKVVTEQTASPQEHQRNRKVQVIVGTRR